MMQFVIDNAFYIWISGVIAILFLAACAKASASETGSPDPDPDKTLFYVFVVALLWPASIPLLAVGVPAYQLFTKKVRDSPATEQTALTILAILLFVAGLAVIFAAQATSVLGLIAIFCAGPFLVCMGALCIWLAHIRKTTGSITH